MRPDLPNFAGQILGTEGVERCRLDIKKPRQPIKVAGFLMVGVARIELATPAMSTQCSTTELHAHTCLG